MKQIIKTLAILYSVVFFIYYLIDALLMIGNHSEPGIFRMGPIIWSLLQLYLFVFSAFIIADNSDKIVDFSWDDSHIFTYGYLAFITISFFGIVGEQSSSTIYTFSDFVIFVVFFLITWLMGFVPKYISQKS